MERSRDALAGLPVTRAARQPRLGNEERSTELSERKVKGDVKYRFVLDLAALR